MQWERGIESCAGAAYRAKIDRPGFWQTPQQAKKIGRDPKNYYQWRLQKPLSLADHYNLQAMRLTLAPFVRNQTVVIEESDEEVAVFVQVYYKVGVVETTFAFRAFHAFQNAIMATRWGVHDSVRDRLYIDWKDQFMSYLDQMREPLAEHFVLLNGNAWKDIVVGVVRWSSADSLIGKDIAVSFPMDFLVRLIGHNLPRHDSVAVPAESTVTAAFAYATDSADDTNIRVVYGRDGTITWRIMDTSQ